MSCTRPALTRLGVGLAALAVLLATACTADRPSADPTADPTADGGAPGAATPAPTPGPALPTGVKVQKLPAADSIKNDVDLRQAVTMSTCRASSKGAGWVSQGTVTNDGKKDRTFTITVFFTTEAATVVASAETKVDVDAGRSEKWTAKKSFPAGKKLLCVLRGVG